MPYCPSQGAPWQDDIPEECPTRIVGERRKCGKPYADEETGGPLPGTRPPFCSPECEAEDARQNAEADEAYAALYATDGILF